MQNGFLKVAVATPRIIVADCAYNADAIMDLMDRAQQDGAKLLLLPELCLAGYTCGDLVLQEALADAALHALDRVKAHTVGSDMLVLVGLPLVVRNLLYNCAAVLQNGRILGVIPKTHLGNYGEFYEKRVFAPAPAHNTDCEICGETVPFGNHLLFVCESMKSFLLGVEICEDLWTALPPSTLLADCGATVLCNLSASDEAVGKSDYRRMLVQSQSSRTTGAYLFASAGDGESTTDVVFSGHDMIYENGIKIEEALPFGEGYAVTEIDLAFLLHERRRFARRLFDDAEILRIPFPMEVAQTKLTRAIWKTPFVPIDPAECAKRCDEVLAIQSHGLKKRIEHIRAKKLVIGVSGGVDSTLALLVCRDALQLLNRPVTDIVALTMPCFGTSHRTKDNAALLCQALGIPLQTIDITQSVRQHLLDIGHASDSQDTAFENAQARERTQVLMDIANMVGGFVVGTGDLSELALGFATFNGDHISMYGVNGDVPKTLIRSILRHQAASSDKTLSDVLLDIVATPVSPELLPGKNGEIQQITEQIIGPYELHDFFLYHLLRRGETREKTLRLAEYAFNGDFDRDAIAKWYDVFIHRFFSQQFKRNCMPDGPRIGNVALSPRGDWRMPSDASDQAFR
ncbi:MAG: NAD(+) synthase [Clostridia bacterium]